jgi:hypothetical protein
MDMAQLVEDLKSFLHLGIAHHKQILDLYRPAIESKLVQADGSVRNSETIRALLEGTTLPDLTQGVIDQLNSYLDHHLLQEQLPPPMPIVAPTGRFRKRELQARIQKWLDSLSDEEGLIFTLQDF